MNWTSIERSGPDGRAVHVQTVNDDGHPHRLPFNPGDDLSSLPEEIQGLIRTIHTPAAIAQVKAENEAIHTSWVKRQDEEAAAAEEAEAAEKKRFDDAVAAAVSRAGLVPKEK